ncbi:MAG: nucleoside-diphosphate sugar epimerase/dehydratase [Trueperaceae bacterium]
MTGMFAGFSRRVSLVVPQASRMPRGWKLLVDAAIMLLVTPLAFAVRYDMSVRNMNPEVLNGLFVTTALLLGLKLGGYLQLRLASRSWSRVTFRDLGDLALMLTGVALAGFVILIFLGPSLNVPRSVPVLDGLLSLSMMAGARAMARYLYEGRRTEEVTPDKRKRVLVVGAGEAGSLIVRELLRHPETGLKPVAFLDDDRHKVGQRFASVPVVGVISDAARVIPEYGIDEVLISMPSESGVTVRRVIDVLQNVKPNLTYKIVPGMYELLSGRVGIKRMRDVEIEDLLGRPSVRLDNRTIEGYLTGKRVMITGAGGSIGAELVRQICRFGPEELILFGHGENSIYSLERELERDWPDLKYRSVIGAIQNGTRLDYIFRSYRPDVVFHAAAHKHVPLMELNPEEAVFNNIVGSRNLVNLALKYGITHFVNISTDKAVNPTSVMGASKRMVEYLVQDAASKAEPGRTFVSVRFGNVLGSRGSVIPVFKSQIRAGGPVTVTHPEMVRYFMTIPEAAQLVLQAAGQGANGQTYILNMGQPVKILDLARDLIKLSGFEPDVDIPIVFSGMRPGEKLFEELMTSDERTRSTSHEKIFVARPDPFSGMELHHAIDILQEAALESDHRRIRDGLASFIRGCMFKGTAEGTAGDTAAGQAASASN